MTVSSLGTNTSAFSGGVIHGEAMRLSVADVQARIDALIEQILALAEQTEGMTRRQGEVREAVLRWQAVVQAKLTARCFRSSSTGGTLVS